MPQQTLLLLAVQYTFDTHTHAPFTQDSPPTAQQCLPQVSALPPPPRREHGIQTGAGRPCGCAQAQVEGQSLFPEH